MKAFNLFICGILILSASSVLSQNQALGIKEEDKRGFIASVAERFPAKERAIIREAAAQWESSASEKSWITLTDAVYATSKAASVRAEVKIDSSKGSGATVKYQTLGERKRKQPATTAKSPTKAEEKMYLGVYHIWTERGGKATSEENAEFQVDELEVPITITER